MPLNIIFLLAYFKIFENSVLVTGLRTYARFTHSHWSMFVDTDETTAEILHYIRENSSRYDRNLIERKTTIENQQRKHLKQSSETFNQMLVTRNTHKNQEIQLKTSSFKTILNLEKLTTDSYKTPLASTKFSQFMKVFPDAPFYDKISAEVPSIVPSSSKRECEQVHRYCTGNSTSMSTSFRCSCSKHCSRNGDCCWDAKPEPEPTLKCIPINQGFITEAGIYMVTKCKMDIALTTVRDFQFEKFKERCENVTSSSGLDQIVPVTSNTLQLVYRNAYCAICNGIPPDDWLNWSLKTICARNESQSLEIAMKTCDFKVIPPVAVSSTHFCDLQVTRSCPQNWKDPDVLQKCNHFYAPVYLSRNRKKIFKNKFCAFCHDVSPKDLRCNSGQNIGAEADGAEPASLALLLDVDQRQGDRVGSKSFCPSGQVALRWTSCKNCSSTPIKDICCFPIWYSTRNDTASCKGAIVPQDNSFVIDVNGTLGLHEKKQYFRQSEYQVLSDGSVIICASEEIQYENKFPSSLGFLTVICLSISLLALVTKLLFLFLRRPLSLANKVLAFLCGSLFVAHSLYLLANGDWSRVTCIVLAIANHYFQLLALTWTLILAVDIHRTFSTCLKRYSSNSGQLKGYILAAFLTPIFPVTIACIVEFGFKCEIFKPGYGDRGLCWITGRPALLVFFALPVAILFLVNITLFCITALRIYATARASKPARDSTFGAQKTLRLTLYVQLALLMGLTWLLGLAAAYCKNDFLWYFFVVGHGLQGTFLLMGFAVCPQGKVFEKVRKSWFRYGSSNTQSSTL